MPAESAHAIADEFFNSIPGFAWAQIDLASCGKFHIDTPLHRICPGLS
jgi:hypothetical protein